VSTSARFCSTCGTALDGRPDAAAPRSGETHETRARRPQDDDRSTQQLPTPNGDGTTPEEAELEATTGGDP